MQYPKLFEPLQVGSLVLRNRIISAPNMMSAWAVRLSPVTNDVMPEEASGDACVTDVGVRPWQEYARKSSVPLWGQYLPAVAFQPPSALL